MKLMQLLDERCKPLGIVLLLLQLVVKIITTADLQCDSSWNLGWSFQVHLLLFYMFKLVFIDNMGDSRKACHEDLHNLICTKSYLMLAHSFSRIMN